MEWVEVGIEIEIEEKTQGEDMGFVNVGVDECFKSVGD